MSAFPLEGTMAVVCGGSKGIGKATAAEIIRLGGSVCLVARTSDTLRKTADELAELVNEDTQKVVAMQSDCGDQQRFQEKMAEFIDTHGVPQWLVNCVGFARPAYVGKLSESDFRASMDGNYFAQLIPTLVLLPYFRQVGYGRIANVSSMMGYFGIAGYAAYAPSKFAVVGLSEVLQNELADSDIGVSVLYPPDTDTPGFAEENLTKPPECAAMSKAGGCLSAEQVAREFVAGIRANRFSIFPGRAKWIWHFHRLFPGLLRWITRRQYLRARRSDGLN